ncbi:hypothetical protein pb186bvf_014552 [Paramecium bursaria]
MDVESDQSDTKQSRDDEDILLNIKVSENQAEKLRRQALEFKNSYEKFEKNFLQEQEEQYFIMSAKWLKSWKKHVSYEQLTQGKKETQIFGRVQLGPLNHELIDTTVEPCFKYSPLKEHPWNIYTKEGLEEGKDYIIVSKEIWHIFQQSYQVDPIPRIAIGQGPQKQVVVNLLRFQSVLLYPSLISSISNNMGYKNSFEKEHLQVDRNLQLKEYYSLLQRTMPTFKGDYAKDNGVRIWRYQTQQQDAYKALFQDIKKQVQDLDYQDEFAFDFVGELLDPNQYEKIEDVGIQTTDLIIIEFKAATRPWCVRNPVVAVESKCESCYQIKILKFPCVCKKVAYCSDECKRNDERFHSSKCDRIGSDDENVRAINLNEHSVKGIVGLGNLGNTCFMNSALQCLSNAQALTEYFLSNRYFDEINEDNPLGTKGQLVRKYGSLLKKMWCGKNNVVVPNSFKQAVGKFQPMFKGFQQHDSSELITFLLDGIHEDLNRIKKKPYVESQDSNGRPDFEVAKESWNNHTARNQSIITDLMYGQYKSNLECPNPQCKRVSITFDPFLTVQLGIPDNKKKFIDLKLYYGFFNFSKRSIPFTKSQTYLLKEFKAKVESDFNLLNQELFFFIPSNYSSYELLSEEKLMNDVRKQSKRSGLSVRQLAEFEASIPKEERIFIQFTNKVNENYGYKRSLQQNGYLVFGLQFTLKQVHLQVFKMLKSLFEEVCEGKVLQNDDELLQFYESNVLKKFYQLDYKSNSSFWQTCSFCNKKTCSDCQVNFDDESVDDVKKRIFKSDSNCNVEFSITWILSPLKNIKIADLFDHYKQNAITEETTDSQQQQGVLPTISLKDCLEFSQLPEQLANDNMWYCKTCQDHVQAYKSMKIYKAPKILMLQLKRFKASNRMFKQKLESFVDFPINGLDMSDYIINSRIPNDYKEENLQDNGEINKKPILYDLFAISNHFGGLGGGHYTAYAKNHIQNKWYNFDDSHASEVRSEDQIVSKAAYVLFYKLREDNTEHQNII